MSHAPIEPKYFEHMNGIGRLIDEELNGKEHPRKHGFVLLMFDMNVPEGRMNYLSNGERKDILSALKELIANFEGRAPDTIGHA